MSSVGTTALDNSYNDALGSAISSATGSSDLGKQEFLMLLVTQLQYQDPLNPMDDTQFVAQLAQFSSLEEQQNTNENLENLIAIQQQTSTITAANYIGKEVSARGYGISLKDGKSSMVQYAAAEEMSSCTVNILDSSTNTIVRTVDLGKRAASIHDFTWDGKRNDGSTAPDGVYTVAFVGYNSSGERVMVDTSVSGLVTGVSYYNGETYLRMDDGRTVTVGNVREVLAVTEAEEEVEDDGSSSSGSDSSGSDSDSGEDSDGSDDGSSSPSTLMEDLDSIAGGAQSALSAWEAARDKIAALLGG